MVTWTREELITSKHILTFEKQHFCVTKFRQQCTPESRFITDYIFSASGRLHTDIPVLFIFYIAPYTEQWIGSFKCDKLVNGTESSWYKFYSTRDWCESFETCLQSMKLKEKCLTDFRFYNSHFWYWPYYPAFTFDVSNYLPNTRIQVYYQRGYGNSYFVVNIIRCESTGKYNGSGTYIIFV